MLERSDMIRRDGNGLVCQAVVQEMSKAIVAARKKSWQPGKNSYGEVEVRQVSER